MAFSKQDIERARARYNAQPKPIKFQPLGKKLAQINKKHQEKFQFSLSNEEYSKSANEWNLAKPTERLSLMREAGIPFGDSRSLRQRHRAIMYYLYKKRTK